MKQKFTLLEMLISVSLFALVAAAGVSLNVGSISTYNSVNDRHQHVQEIIRVDETLQRLITSMKPFWWKAEEGKQNLFLGLPDSMRFVSRGSVKNFKDGAFRFCELYVDDEAQLVVRYQMRPLTEGVEFVEDETLYSILAREVNSVELSYAGIEHELTAGENQADLMPEWQAEWDELRVDLPLAVWVKVNWQNGVSENFMWRTSGNGRYERLGQWQNGVELK